MSISSDIIDLSATITGQVRIPCVNGIWLPPLSDSDEIKDEFGFVFLEDGSVGPFYVSLPGLLEDLWRQYPDLEIDRSDVVALVNRLNGGSLPERALAIGAYNALSDHVYKQSDYLARHLNSQGGTKLPGPVAGEQVGMVGYFAPLISRYLEQGIEVLVLELNPDRVKSEPGVQVTTTVSDLADCQHIICTASTLINDTLESILAVKNESAILTLTGPSSSGLPDVVFRHGVDAVGGVYFPELEELQKVLAKNESWKKVGEKYQINASDYPGVEAMLG